MSSSYSPNLRLELIGTGEQAGIWGVTTNTNLGTLIEQAIAGYTSISITDANYTLTALNGASDQARSMALNITSSVSLTATRDIICPSVSKLYVIRNNTSGGQSIIIRTSAGSGVTIPTSTTAIVFCNGTDVFSASSSSGSGVTSLTTSSGLSTNTAATGAVSVTNTGVIGVTASTGLSTSASTGSITLTNTGVTGLTGGTGISASSSTGSVTVTNTGVTSLTTSSGLSANASATGAVSITNTGVTQITAGSGISISGSTGNVTITNTGGGGGGITAVTATSPVVSSGGSAPDISMPAAAAGTNGYMTSAYATKLDGIAAGATNVTNTNQLTNGAGFVTSAGTVANAGFATTAGTANAVAWTNVSGRPTNVSAFTNDAGYITAATVPANGAVGNYALSYFGAAPALGSTVAGSVLGSLNACCVFVAYGYSGTWRVEGSTTQTSVLLVRIA